jgi:hypothetical protein
VTYKELPWTQKRKLAIEKKQALREVIGVAEYKRAKRRGCRFPHMSTTCAMIYIAEHDRLTTEFLDAADERSARLYG